MKVILVLGKFLSERKIMMVPGPSNIDPAILRAMSHPSESHMSASFAEKYKRVLESLKKVFITKGETFAIAGSGTLAQEIGIANVIRPGDRVLNLVHGLFSGRFVDMTKRHRGLPKTLEVPWGEAITAGDVERELQKNDYRAVTCSHVETSTAVAIPLQEIGEVVKESGAFFVVDTVCSLGGLEVKNDEWGIDVNCTCSQKCMGVPPGLALLAAGVRMVRYLEERKETVDLFYGDLREWLRVVRDPWKNYYATQPVNLIYAIDRGLRQILDEGLENRIKRHRLIAQSFRVAMEALGLKLVAEPRYAADTVTGVYYPDGVEDLPLRNEVARYGVIISRGFGPFRGKIFRVGHMGSVSANDIMVTISAIERALKKFGHRFRYGIGCGAAQEVLSKL